MRLTLKNIAKVKEANIELNGITVIAGENNTGKSTVGKALYSVFNSLHDIEKQIYNEKVYSINSSLIVLYSIAGRYIFDEDRLAKKIIDKFSNEIIDNDLIKSYIVEAVFADSGILVDDYEDKLNETVARIRDIVDIPDENIRRVAISKRLINEFRGQINNIYSKENGLIELSIKDKLISIEIYDNEVQQVNNIQDLKKEAVYIDNPFILDEVNMARYFDGRYADHKTHIISKLCMTNNKVSAVAEILVNNKLESIYSKIDSVCEGNIISDKTKGLIYKEKDSDKSLNIENISAGLKTFAILKTLLENGTIEQNGTIILDEPEIHLHPQWQLLFAEIIVLLQKEFGLHVLINTHSPYFLNAIEVYASKYEIADKCKYYLAHMDGDMSVIEDVTDIPEEIYKLLARPFQDLENTRYE